MSQENVQIAERAMDAFNRRDVDGFVESATSDFEWLPAMGATVERDSFLGREGAEKYFEELHDTWEGVRLAGEELRDLGDRTLFLGRIEGRGRASGVPVDSPFGAVFDFRGNQFSRVCSYLDHGEALRAAGLSE